MDWEMDKQGINTGGWGLRLKTEDMAKFAQLFLQKGKWNGKQILPASWIEEASTKKILQSPDAPQSRRDSSDWLQGYCYQMHGDAGIMLFVAMVLLASSDDRNAGTRCSAGDHCRITRPPGRDQSCLGLFIAGF